MMSKNIFIALSLFFTFTIVSAQICRIDLGIIFDDSGSIKHWGFEEEKNFIRKVTRQLHISSSNTRVAIMTFSTWPKMRVHFKDRAGQDLNSLNWALSWIRHSGGWTNTDRALNLARSRMFHEHYGSRKGAPKMLLLLTDGMSQSGSQKLSHAATLLKNNFVNIISIGVGPKVRKSELELIASRPINQHVFEVKDVWSLKDIVDTVKTEACKPITCWYIHCVYNEWSSWSGTCYRVQRTRTVRQEIRKSKKVVGGCAGLNILKCKPEVERKDLGVCLQTCRYVKCIWGDWSAWSASCGRASRQRKINAVPATTKRRSCLGLPQRCYERPKTERRSTKCNCNYVECKYGQWSQWSTTCGRGERRRNMQAIRKTTQRVNCAGLPQTCSNTPDIQTRNQKCSCNYVECKYGAWSAWTTSCGKGQRSRQMQTIRKTVQRESCNGLPTSCPTKPDIQTRTEMCNCNYVECNYGQWSQWSTTCGRGERRRNMQAIRKTTRRVNCAGLPQTCSNTPDIQTRNQKCSCNYVECKYGAWSAWTTSCGKGQRSRQMQTIRKTVQRENCNGLPTSCPTKPDIQTRTEMCQCNYVECKYGEWSAWTTTCGKGERGRKLKPIPKTKEAESCDNLPKTCSVTPDVEARTTMCTCSYVECQYGPWSAWTTTCGKGERGRKMQAIQKTKQAERCDGLTQSCPTTPDVEERNKLCKCDYVECKYTEWTSWNPACGKNMERKRTLQTIKKSAERESCSGLKTTCTGDAEQSEKKDELCECDGVRCVTQWSAWSATCGLIKRTLRFVKVPIKIKQESCDGIKTTCPDLKETQVDDIPCPKTSPPVSTPGPSSADAACNSDFKAMGCFKNSKDLRKEFRKILFVDPYKKSSAYSFSDYLFDIVCRCASATKADKFQYFALSSKGHCIAGGGEEDSWVKHSTAKSSFCLSAKYDSCKGADTHCIGREDTLFAYKIVA